MNDKQMLLDILMFELPDPNPWEGEIRLLIDRLVANGVTVQKWIGVEERLPEKTGRVLIRSASGFIGSADYFSDNGFSSGGMWIPVTHWMPLPEPPKEE